MTNIINMICLSIFNITPANSSSDSINEEVICSNGISNDNSSGDNEGAVTAQFGCIIFYCCNCTGDLCRD